MCEQCEASRQWPQHDAYSLGCLWCGARIIQAIRGRRKVPQDERTRRAKAELARWVAWGHSELEIRRLVAENKLIAPEATRKRR
jgi:hypothetical protein